MNRRSCLKTVAMAGAASALGAAPGKGKPTQLHVDLDVDPAKEQQWLQTYHSKFQPAISRQPGFVEVALMKLESTLQGSAPANTNYRLLISFQTEEQRKAWVATQTHQTLWPMMEKNLRSKNYNVILFQVV